MARWFRGPREEPAPIADITSDAVSVTLQQLENRGQYAIFELPDPKAFVQVQRDKGGGLHLEVSLHTPELEALVGQLGNVTFIEDYGFPAVDALPGDDGRVAHVIAEALAMLASAGQYANEVRLETGRQ